MSQIISRPSSTTVRLWAVANGLASQSRGRLSDHAIKEFNKAHGLWGANAYAKDEPVRRHTVKPAKGRSITRSYRVSEARKWAVENGHSEPGQRGRMSKATLDAYVLTLVNA
jgi:hypothetical protein